MQTIALTATHQQVLHLIATGASISAAADASGVHRNTIANWRRTIPEFAHQFALATRERSSQLQEQAAELAPKAFEVLCTILHNEQSSPSLRFRAATFVLKLAMTPPVPLALPEIPVYEPENTAQSAQAAELEEAELEEAAQSCTITPFVQTARPPVEPSRNSICRCGSGLKYKRCCANRPRVQHAAA